MRLLRFLPVLAVLLPLLARAQAPVAPPPAEEPPPLSVPTASGSTEAPGPFDPEPSASLLPPPEPLNYRVGRLLLETLGGAAGSALGLTAGYYGGRPLLDSVGCGFDDCIEKDVLTLGMLGVGLTLGASAGVFGGGALLEGQGHFLPTLGGAVLAEGAVVGLLALGFNVDVSLAAFLVAPLVGALVGYEVSHVLSRPGMVQPARARSALRVTPVVGPAPGGGMLGLVGRF